MHNIHYIGDNYIFGQYTEANVLSVTKINTFYKIGFGENNFFTLNKSQDNQVILRAYTINVI
jgi:hypothetical protein